MSKKCCSMCKQEKLLSEYHKSGKTTRGECRVCSSEKRRVERQKKAQDEEYVQMKRKKQREYYNTEIGKKKQQEASAKWYASNKSKIAETHQKYRKTHQDEEQKRHAVYYQANKERIHEYRTEFYNANPGKKLALKCRQRLNKYYKQGKRYSELIGCTHDFLVEWFEFYFKFSDLSFDTHGVEWHIDHVIPCSAFDLSDENNMKKCFHWSNLAPLHSVTNLRKGSNIWKNAILVQNIRLKLFCKQKNIQSIEIQYVSETPQLREPP